MQSPAPASRGARIWAAIRAEVTAQASRWPLWTPVAFGGGCAIYFGLRHEPSGLLVFGVLAVCLVLTLVARWLAPRAPYAVAALILCVAAGGAVSKVRQMRVAAPIAPADLGAVDVEGWLLDVAGPGKRGAKVLIAPVSISRLSPEQTPVRIRVTLDGPTPPPGSPVRFKAILNAPPAPASPGAYDFGRDAYFQSIGAVGLALGPARAAYLDDPPRSLRWSMAINAWRWNLAQKIVARIGEREGGVSVAMTTGHEAWLTDDELADMRDSGLAHLLSISGVHMAIVGGFSFFLARLFIALVPWLALRVDGKKTAAWVGLVCVGVYLVVSGAPAPAVRSAITASVAFIAILLDRRAVTFNALAVAAFLVLLMRPESVVQPGFQMSFAATAALVALAEVWPRRIREISAPWPILAAQRLGSWVWAGLAASFVAGLATGPFAIQHFNRTAAYGLIANALESPLSTFITMPALALGAALEPLGVGRPFLIVAGWGVEATLGIAHVIARLPYAVQIVPSAPQAALAVSFLGLLFVCLWRGKLRWLGGPFAAAVLIWPRPAAPDVWVASDGSNAAVRTGREAVVLRPDAKAFAAGLWSRRRGLSEPADPQAALEARWDCGRFSCTPERNLSPRVAGWWGRKAPTDEQLSGLCAASDLIVVRATVDRLPGACEGRLLLDGADFARGGALELWRRGDGWAGRWASDLRGQRPWTG